MLRHGEERCKEACEEYGNEEDEDEDEKKEGESRMRWRRRRTESQDVPYSQVPARPYEY